MLVGRLVEREVVVLAVAVGALVAVAVLVAAYEQKINDEKSF